MKNIRLWVSRKLEVFVAYFYLEELAVCSWHVCRYSGAFMVKNHFALYRDVIRSNELLSQYRNLSSPFK